MVASGSLVWCWRDGRWVPLRLSSIKLSGAVTKAHWDAVNEFLSLAASQRLFLQEGSLSLEQPRGLNRIEEKQLSLDSGCGTFTGESDVDDNNNKHNSTGEEEDEDEDEDEDVEEGSTCEDTTGSSGSIGYSNTCGELNGVTKLDVLSWLQNNQFDFACDESSINTVLPVEKTEQTEEKGESREQNLVGSTQSLMLQNILLVDRNTDKKNSILNRFMRVTERPCAEWAASDNSSLVEFVVRCLSDSTKSGKKLALEANGKSVAEDGLGVDRDVPKINVLNYLQFLEETSNTSLIEGNKSAGLRWQKLVIGTKNDNKYNLDDTCVVNECEDQDKMTNIILKPLERKLEKSGSGGEEDDPNDILTDFRVSPLQRHLRRPIKHKQPCRHMHKVDEKSSHSKKFPLNYNNSHPPLENCLIKKEVSEDVLEHLPRVNSLSQTRLEWHQLIQDDKEIEKEKPKVSNNKNSFSKVSINVLNLQRFSKLVRQRKNCDTTVPSEDKWKSKSKKDCQVKEPSTDLLKRSDSNSDGKKESKDDGFRSLRTTKNYFKDSMDDYADLPKDGVNGLPQWQKLLPKNKDRRSSEDVARYSETPTSNDKISKSKNSTVEKKKTEDQERYSDEPHKDGEPVSTFASWLQKRRSLPEKTSFTLEEQERYSDEPCQWQKMVLKQSVFGLPTERKPKRYREAWMKNIRKLSEGLRPLILQE
ncbi:hypothetical protein RUM44_011705 [Polyplax serrata]|uniref:Uncharacterized protein n=1 Tax=Polyplax serrata TaxID=468196 RepID=A0ABR1AQV8_POLSC